MQLLYPTSIVLNVGQAGLFRVQEVDPKRFHYYAKFQKLSLATQLVSISMSIISLYLELDKRWHLTSKLDKLMVESKQEGLRALRPSLMLMALPIGLVLGGAAISGIALAAARKLNIFYHKEVAGLNPENFPEGTKIERDHSGSLSQTIRQAAYLIQLGLDTCAFGFCRNPLLLANGGVSLHNLLLLARRQWVQLSATKRFDLGDHTLKLQYSIARREAQANPGDKCVVCLDPLTTSDPSFSFCPNHPPAGHDQCTVTNAATQLATLNGSSRLSVRSIHKNGRFSHKEFTATLIDKYKPFCPTCRTQPNGNTFEATVHHIRGFNDRLDTDAALEWTEA